MGFRVRIDLEMYGIGAPSLLIISAYPGSSQARPLSNYFHRSTDCTIAHTPGLNPRCSFGDAEMTL